jgi:hypothetical protein
MDFGDNVKKKNRDMRLLQKIKHWQLFLLFFLPSYFINSRLSMIIIMMSILTLFSAWIYSIGVSGQSIKGGINKQKYLLTLFKISCLLMPIFWLINIVDQLVLLNIESGESIMRIINLIINIMFLLTGIYMILYVSKTIKGIELKRKPKFTDYILTIIWFIILPVGIWFIQPRINKIYTK